MNLELYLHFPFCVRKCLYCDFCSEVSDSAAMLSYCDAMCEEIRLNAKEHPDDRVTSIFLGGGTPSIVPEEAIVNVLRTVGECFSVLPEAEITSEANPGTLTEKWLSALQAQGLNRLSLGVQAMQDRLLRTIGRIHTKQDAVDAFGLARKCGISNINLDLMFGLPGQTLGDWMRTLQDATELRPEHISAYSLILEECTPLEHMVRGGELQLPSEDTTAAMYEDGIRVLKESGYEQYEVSNFARPGYRCRHNLGYWQDVPYLGFGTAAHSMLPVSVGEGDVEGARIRFSNVRDTSEYISAMKRDPERRIAAKNVISRKEAMFETLMLRLRTTEGLDEEAFEHVHGEPFPQSWKKTAAQLAKLGFIRILPRGFTLTERGLAVQNELLTHFME